MECIGRVKYFLPPFPPRVSVVAVHGPRDSSSPERTSGSRSPGEGVCTELMHAEIYRD